MRAKSAHEPSRSRDRVGGRCSGRPAPMATPSGFGCSKLQLAQGRVVSELFEEPGVFINQRRPEPTCHSVHIVIEWGRLRHGSEPVLTPLNLVDRAVFILEEPPLVTSRFLVVAHRPEEVDPLLPDPIREVDTEEHDAGPELWGVVRLRFEDEVLIVVGDDAATRRAEIYMKVDLPRKLADVKEAEGREVATQRSTTPSVPESGHRAYVVRSPLGTCEPGDQIRADLAVYACPGYCQTREKRAQEPSIHPDEKQRDDPSTEGNPRFNAWVPLKIQPNPEADDPHHGERPESNGIHSFLHRGGSLAA